MRSLLLLVVVAGLSLFGCSPPHQTAEAPAEPAAPVETETVAAEAGVGKEGQKLKGKEGVMITPIKALFNTKQRVAFEFKVEPALRLYEAEKGYRPKTHEEFMDKIIKFNQIELPELPAGHEYVYDPAKGELMVKRPKQ